MKKTIKPAAKPGTKTTPVNNHLIEMDRIAFEMAVLFDEKIPASKLAKWLVIANEQGTINSSDILFNLGYCTLPGLIECKSRDQRIEFLTKEIPMTFSNAFTANEFLFQLGADFLLKIKGKGFNIEQVDEFINPYTTLLAVCEMFDNYRQEKEKL